MDRINILLLAKCVFFSSNVANWGIVYDCCIHKTRFKHSMNKFVGGTNCVFAQGAVIDLLQIK